MHGPTACELAGRAEEGPWLRQMREGYAGQTDPKSCPVGGLWTACHARSADLDQTGSPACVAA
jgi:hypothetical protein